LQTKVRERQYRLTSHAEKEREADQIIVQEIDGAVLSNACELVEDFPTDPRGHSCLILRWTRVWLPVHIVCGHLHEEECIVITICRTDPAEWIDWRNRREPG
jgi:uncharacterized protein DUF4258